MKILPSLQFSQKQCGGFTCVSRNSILFFTLFWGLINGCSATIVSSDQTGEEALGFQPYAATDDSANFLGVNSVCNIWATDAQGAWSPEAAFEECDGDLTLIKNLGVSWVRLTFPWYFMVDQAGTLIPERKNFLISLMESATAKGMNMLLVLGHGVPSSAYHCSEAVAPSTGSLRLDFCDADFVQYLVDFMDIVAPYAHHFELLNEANWTYLNQAPPGTANAVDYVMSRMKGLHLLLKQVATAKTTATFQPVIHGTGISYFYNSRYPTMGWQPPADTLIEATFYLYWMQHGWQPAGQTILNDYMDAINFHPYFTSQELRTEVLDFTRTTQSMVHKEIWATETNSTVSDETEQIMVFAEMSQLAQEKTLNKFFWYVIRDPMSHAETALYALYDSQRNALKPNLVAAIRAEARTVPFEARFGRSQSVVLFDFTAAIQTAHWYANGYQSALTVGVPDAQGAGVQIASMTAEDGSTHASSIFVSMGSTPVQNIQGDYYNIQLPATGSPTFHAQIALSQDSAPQSMQTFDVYVNDLTAGKQYTWSFAKTYNATAETIEVDLSLCRGHTIHLVLNTPKGSAKGAMWINPQLIHR